MQGQKFENNHIIYFVPADSTLVNDVNAPCTWGILCLIRAQNDFLAGKTAWAFEPQTVRSTGVRLLTPLAVDARGCGNLEKQKPLTRPMLQVLTGHWD